MGKRNNEKPVDAPKKAKLENDFFALDPKEKIYTEYYPEGLSYAKTTDGSEKYAKNEHSDEIYLKKENGEPIFAKKFKANKLEIFFARNKHSKFWVDKYNNIPFYPVDAKGHPIFPTHHGDQLYAVNEDEVQVYPETSQFVQTYAKKKDGREYAAVNKDGLEFYATNLDDQRHVIEQYPKDKDGTPKYFIHNEKIQYARNILMDRPIYQKDTEENETYFTLVGDEQYGQDSKGKEYYRKLKTGGEEMAIYKHSQIYAKDEEQNEYYPKNENNVEIYRSEPKPEGIVAETPAQTKDKKYFYAKNSLGDEYYPKISRWA